MRDELGAASRGNILPRLLKQRDLPPAGQGPRDNGDAGKKHRGKDHEDHYFFIYH